jgi:hypothetical protein
MVEIVLLEIKSVSQKLNFMKKFIIEFQFNYFEFSEIVFYSRALFNVAINI